MNPKGLKVRGTQMKMKVNRKEVKVNTHPPLLAGSVCLGGQLPLARGGHRQNRTQEHTCPEPTPLGAPGGSGADRSVPGQGMAGHLPAQEGPAGPRLAFYLGTARRSWSQGLGASPSAWEQITASGKEREKTHSRENQSLGAETALPESCCVTAAAAEAPFPQHPSTLDGTPKHRRDLRRAGGKMQSEA